MYLYAAYVIDLLTLIDKFFVDTLSSRTIYLQYFLFP